MKWLGIIIQAVLVHLGCSNPVPSQLTQYHAQDALGQYSFGYNAPGSVKQEYKTEDGVIKGSYVFRTPSGEVVQNVYVADDTGFYSSLAPGYSATEKQQTEPQPPITTAPKDAPQDHDLVGISQPGGQQFIYQIATVHDAPKPKRASLFLPGYQYDPSFIPDPQYARLPPQVRNYDIEIVQEQKIIEEVPSKPTTEEKPSTEVETTEKPSTTTYNPFLPGYPEFPPETPLDSKLPVYNVQPLPKLPPSTKAPPLQYDSFYYGRPRSYIL